MRKAELLSIFSFQRPAFVIINAAETLLKTLTNAAENSFAWDRTGWKTDVLLNKLYRSFERTAVISAPPRTPTENFSGGPNSKISVLAGWQRIYFRIFFFRRIKFLLNTLKNSQIKRTIKLCAK